MNKRARGSDYEEIACGFLEKNGVVILERNFRCRRGEIDIIGLEKSEKESRLVFFEVKYRSGDKYGTASEAVDIRKQSVICNVSDFYRTCHKQYYGLGIRYDVIAFQKDDLKWIKDAFGYCGKGF